ncbi:Scr1 family TA system antitoxin-like transcriptional regulator [Streptomyces hundungensis]|uniref:Scr1 family TA system antitoxin-like transcriptional regulator n=1 Tax=Streptomyces hundungensis TaxID=1077946 RepID=UPI0034031D8F
MTNDGVLTEAQLPMRIVTGLYLRCLRTAARIRQEKAAREARASVSAVSRWERAESPLSPRALEPLLTLYRVPRREMEFLLRDLPPQRYNRREDTSRGLADRARYDHWADVSEEATARYLALMRAAERVVEFCMVIPDGLRTRAYRDAMLATAIERDSEDIPDGMPSWFRRSTWEQGRQSRRLVLLDETVLARPAGGYAAMSEQLWHLAHLIRSEKEGGHGLTLRVVPTDRVLPVHLYTHPAELTLNGQTLVAHWGFFPSYETNSRTALRLSEGLREATALAYSSEESLALIESAASAMEPNSLLVHVPHGLRPRSSTSCPRPGSES